MHHFYIICTFTYLRLLIGSLTRAQTVMICHKVSIVYLWHDLMTAIVNYQTAILMVKTLLQAVVYTHR